MTQPLKTGIRQYFEMGAQLANPRGLPHKIRTRFPEAAQRSVVIEILRPHPEVSSRIPNWLLLYTEDKLKPGAIQVERFAIYLDPINNDIVITDAWRISDSTVTFFIEEHTCWALAARKETVYTAYIRNHPIRVQGTYVIRDIELIDEILDSFYNLLKSEGRDLAEVFAGAAT